MAKGKSRRQRAWTRARAVVRQWRFLLRETLEILEPLDTARLVVTHILFVYAEQILAAIGMRVWGRFPERIEPPRWRGTRGTVVLAPGLR